MLFRDMKCFACGNPPEKESLPQGEKLGLTDFFASGGGFFDKKPYEGHGIKICDSCLIQGGRQGRVYRTVTEHRPANNYEYIWNPDGDDKYYSYPPPVLRIRTSTEGPSVE